MQTRPETWMERPIKCTFLDGRELTFTCVSVEIRDGTHVKYERDPVYQLLAHIRDETGTPVEDQILLDADTGDQINIPSQQVIYIPDDLTSVLVMIK